MAALVFMVGLVLALTVSADELPGAFEQQTQWVMGTTLRISLPTDLDDRHTIFNACFAAAHHWDRQLSPWKPEAPLTRLSASAGSWVTVPDELLDYLERAVHDAARSDGIFDITLTHEGSRRLAIDRDLGRARIPAGSRALDPGADGKGVAMDAITAILEEHGVTSFFLDFGGSSFVARGRGPATSGWQIALTGPSGQMLGTVQLMDTALSVSSTVQHRQGEDWVVEDRYHLVDLRTGDPVTVRRTAAVLAPSATEAEVLSTVAAILGHGIPAGFPGCALGVFGDHPDESRIHSDFQHYFTSVNGIEPGN